MKRIIRLLMAMAITGAIAFSASGYVAAQDEGFTLGIQAVVCPENYAGPFVGCESWVGAEISVVSADGTVNEMCVTAVAASATEARVASCTFEFPFGSTITATLLSAPPDGWVLTSQVEQTMQIPDSPPDGIFGGPTFVAQPVAASEVPAGTGGQSADPSDVNALPSTGRGSVMTGADTHQLVTEQIMLTIMVLAAVVSVAFASLALFVRQKDL
jgi:hypothetical protein